MDEFYLIRKHRLWNARSSKIAEYSVGSLEAHLLARRENFPVRLHLGRGDNISQKQNLLPCHFILDLCCFYLSLARNLKYGPCF